MAHEFLVWANASVENAVMIDDVRGIPDPWELNEGVSRAEGFPDDAVCIMDPDRPHDTLLVDNLRNTDRLVLASTRLKEFLESRALSKVEYLPVTVLDHKKRPAAGGNYWIVHPLDPIDCLNDEECGAKFSAIDKTKIKFLKKLVIDESKIGSDRHFFRAQRYNKATIVRRDLAEAIQEQGFTGIRWVELEDYRG